MKRSLTTVPHLESLETRDLPAVNFASAVFVPAAGATAVAVGDFNGDRIPDLATASLWGTDLSVRLGRGGGSFGPLTSFALPSRFAHSVVAGDFNNDGKLDVAVSSDGMNILRPNYGFVSVLLGNGDGTFQPARNLSAGEDPRGLALGDFNRDGKLDILVANSTAGDVGLFLGNGDGTFRNLGGHDTGSDPWAVVAADFDRDGKLDFAVANAGSNNVGVFLGNGDGTFRNLGGFATGSRPRALTVGDFNGDRIPDLATADQNSNTASVLLGRGDGTFRPALALATGGKGPRAVAAGDFDGDGTPDLLAGAGPGASPHVRVFSGRDLSELASLFAFDPAFSGGVRLASADCNGDGRDDVVASSGWGSAHLKVFEAGNLSELLSFFALDNATAGAFVAASS